MSAMKKGGSTDMAQDKAMLRKAMSQHDAQEHKGGKGTKLALKGGGNASSFVNTKMSDGDKTDRARGTGGVRTGAAGYKDGGTISGNATWNGSGYGSCIPTGCATGYHVEGGLCLTNDKTCTVGASTGVQSWSSGSTYGDCKLALGSLCTGTIDCASGRCATGPAGTANDRCAPAGMNYIPGGTYIMGSPATETARRTDETQHQVTITRPFFLGEKEVTQADWTARSGGTNPSCFQTTTGTTCTTSNANSLTITCTTCTCYNKVVNG
jgi:hypothetical protein